MASSSKIAKVDKNAKFVRVPKYETKLSFKLEKDIINSTIEKLVCDTCKWWGKRISGSSNFFLMWIWPGLTSIEKDSLVNCLKGEQHKIAADLQTKCKIVVEAYQRNVVAPVFLGIMKMREKEGLDES